MEIETETTHRRDRLELVSRGMLGAALLAGVAWALFDGGLRWAFQFS